MNQHVQAFDQAIRDPNNVTENGIRRGQISLEFFNKKKVNWPFTPECLPWEVWTIRIEIKTIRSEIGTTIVYLVTFDLDIKKWFS